MANAKRAGQRTSQVGIRLATTDLLVLRQLASHLNASQAGIVAMALRHLTETLRRGQPVYMDTHGIQPSLFDGDAT
jgi:hypothetical protein